MTELIRQHVIPAAYTVLPSAMASPQATAMLMAIGWQESRFEHRQQIGGPARGFWQFEQRGGVVGVLSHPQTRDTVRSAMRFLHYRYEPTPHGCYDAIGHNDILAAVFARLLLWTVPHPLPRADQREHGWRQYREAWRPGRPHEETWGDAWRTGWSTT